MKNIGIYPALALTGHTRRLQLLGRIFPVCWIDCQQGVPGGLDGLVLLEDNPALLGQAARSGVRSFALSAAAREAGGATQVAFGSSRKLDARLRGRAIEERAETLRVLAPPEDGDEIMAEARGRPLWVRRRREAACQDLVARAADEMLEGECLWDHLRGGRFLGLLPPIHFFALAYLGWILCPRTSRLFQTKGARTIVYCGQHSLKLFCVGLVLSHLICMIFKLGHYGTFMQLPLSASDWGMMIACAYLMHLLKEKPWRTLAPAFVLREAPRGVFERFISVDLVPG